MSSVTFLGPQKCTKIVGGWGFAPDPTEGAYSATQTLWLRLRWSNSRVPTAKGREEMGVEESGGEGRGRQNDLCPGRRKPSRRHCYLLYL